MEDKILFGEIVFLMILRSKPLNLATEAQEQCVKTVQN